MNLFRSEEHVREWRAEHPELESEVLSVEQTLDWVTFIGRERPRFDYVHPRATGELGPFLKSIGLTGYVWQK